MSTFKLQANEKAAKATFSRAEPKGWKSVLLSDPSDSSATATSPTASRAYSLLHSIPTVLILHLSNEFLTDRGAHSLACSSSQLLLDLTNYQIKALVRAKWATRIGATNQPHPLVVQNVNSSAVGRSKIIRLSFGVVQSVSVGGVDNSVPCDYRDRDLIPLLPASTHHLALHPEWRLESSLPPALTSLVLSRHHVPPIDSIRTSTIRSLKFQTQPRNRTFESMTMFRLDQYSSLTSLHFDWQFNESLVGITLPLTLTELHMCDGYNGEFNDVLEPLLSLTSLKMGGGYVNVPSKQMITKLKLPTSICTLQLGVDYLSNVSTVGAELTILLAPLTSLTDLSFSEAFDCPIHELRLPDSVEKLNFKSAFNQPLEVFMFPAALRQLRMSAYVCRQWYRYLEQIKQQCPNFRRLFQTGSMREEQTTYSAKILSSASNLESLSSTIPSSYNIIHDRDLMPSTICELNISGAVFDFIFGLKRMHPPPCLTSLKIEDYRTKDFLLMSTPYWSPPSSLTRLDLQGAMRIDVHSLVLPPLLRFLKMPSQWSKPLRQWVLPSTLEELDLNSSFDHPLRIPTNWQPPSTLRVLRVGDYWKQSVTELNCPSGLQQLHFGSGFNMNVDQLQLPNRLIGLYFSQKFNQPLHQIHLPSSLRVLVLPNSFSSSLPSRSRIPVSLRLIYILHSVSCTSSQLDQLDSSWQKWSLQVGLPFGCSVRIERKCRTFDHTYIEEDPWD